MTFANTNLDVDSRAYTGGVPISWNTVTDIPCQRINDERGGMHVIFEADPGACTGDIVLTARLSPTLARGIVYESGADAEAITNPVGIDMTTLDAVLFSGTNNSIPILPLMSFRALSVQTTNSVTGNLHFVE